MYLNNPTMFSPYQTKQWLKNLPETSQRLIVFDNYVFFIGLVRIDHIDHINKNCMIGLDITTEERGRGHAKHIYNQLFDYWFNQMNMNMMYLEVLETNQRAIHIYAKLGFKPVGKIRQAIFRNGQYEDSIIMDLLQEEYHHKGKNNE